MPANGYDAPTGSELREQFESTFNANLDDVQLDFTPGTVPGALSAAVVQVLGDLSEKTQQLYDQRRLQNAEGQDLEDLVKIAGITRQNSTFSIVELVAQGTSTPIPLNTEVRGPNGFKWVVDEDSEVTSPPNPVRFQCETRGPINVSQNSNWNIITPIQGVEGFDNPDPATPGQPRESDPKLIRRRNRQFSLGTTRQVGSLRAAIEQLPFINHQVIVENRSNEPQTVQGFEIDDNAYIVVVEPTSLSESEKDELAETIYEFGPEAIRPDLDPNVGNPFTREVTARDGGTYTVRWHGANETIYNVEVTIRYSFTNDSARKTSIENQITEQIEDYFNELEVGERIFEAGLEARCTEIQDQAGLNTVELFFTEGPSGDTDHPHSVDMFPSELAVLGDVTFQEA